MNYKRLLYLVALAATFVGAGNPGYAQCKSFSKKKCLPSLAPYIHNGQMNATTFFEGENASLDMTFYSGQEYRLLVCSHKMLGDEVYFQIKDSENSEIYNSKGKGDTWDFNVGSTQQLIIEVIVGQDKENLTDIVPSGCVAILIGFKE